jgi:hypothetical protein
MGGYSILIHNHSLSWIQFVYMFCYLLSLPAFYQWMIWSQFSLWCILVLKNLYIITLAPLHRFCTTPMPHLLTSSQRARGDGVIWNLSTRRSIDLSASAAASTVNSATRACSVGRWLMAGAGLFWEKSTAGWLRLVTDGWFVLREKYCWLVADKPNEQAAACVSLPRASPHHSLFSATSTSTCVLGWGWVAFI